MAGNKYSARKTSVFGIKFDSQKEANRYLVLKSRLDNNEITDLVIHPKFVLVDGFTDNQGNRQRAITYSADFEYLRDGEIVVEDVKGGKATQTAVFRIKKKLFLKRYPEITFRIV